MCVVVPTSGSWFRPALAHFFEEFIFTKNSHIKISGNNSFSKLSLHMSLYKGRALLFPRAGVGFGRLPFTFSEQMDFSRSESFQRKKSFPCDLSQLIALYKSVPCKWDVRCCSHERELVSTGSRSSLRSLVRTEPLSDNLFLCSFALSSLASAWPFPLRS